MLGGGGGGLTATNSWRRCGGRRRRRRHRRVDVGLPGAIARRRRERRLRRRRWRGPIRSWRLESTAVCGGARLGHGHGAAAPRVSLQGGKKVGKRGRQVAEGVLCLQGGPGSEGSTGERPRRQGGARPWRQGFPCRHSDDTDREGPLSGSSPFSFSFYFPVAFRDLIRAFKPF